MVTFPRTEVRGDLNIFLFPSSFHLTPTLSKGEGERREGQFISL